MRTKSGLEVNFVLGNGQVAIEVKSSDQVTQKDLVALAAFIAEHQPWTALLVCSERAERSHQNIRIVPDQKFLTELWQDQIIR